MNKRNSTFSIAAILAASVLALQAPGVGAAGSTASTGHDSKTTAQASDQSGVPGVEVNVGSNASDRGLPGVEMNVGADGDQKNLDTQTLGAGPAPSDPSTNESTTRPMRTDRN